jgi:hypothetical protein
MAMSAPQAEFNRLIKHFVRDRKPRRQPYRSFSTQID